MLKCASFWFRPLFGWVEGGSHFSWDVFPEKAYWSSSKLKISNTITTESGVGSENQRRIDATNHSKIWNKKSLSNTNFQEFLQNHTPSCERLYSGVQYGGCIPNMMLGNHMKISDHGRPNWTNGRAVPLAWCANANHPINITNIYVRVYPINRPRWEHAKILTKQTPSTNIVSVRRPPKEKLFAWKTNINQLLQQTWCQHVGPPNPKKTFQKKHPHKLFWPQVTSNFAPAVHNDHRWVPWSESCFGSGHRIGKLLGPAWWQDLG